MSCFAATARLLLIMAALMALAAPSSAARGANASEQVVFSLTAHPESVGTFGPFGYWIWCEASLTNPGAYAGECSGSIYFYAIKAAPEHVNGSISELSEGQYQMAVQSADWSCTLTNTPPVTSGPTNTVVVSCSTPLGSGTATKSIVNVTGP